MPEYQRNEREIGALWLRVSKKGTKFMSGTINGQQVVVFKNANAGGKKPDYLVLKSEPKPQTTPAPPDRDDDDEIGF